MTTSDLYSFGRKTGHGSPRISFLEHPRPSVPHGSIIVAQPALDACGHGKALLEIVKAKKVVVKSFSAFGERVR
jgi:hypothetical protein